MLNYEKITLVVVAYRFNIEGLLQLNTEAPIFVQVRHVAQTSVVVAPVAFPGRLSSSEYDISYVHNSNIKRLQLNICTKKPKLDHYYSSRVDYRFVESFLENSQLTWCIHSTVGDDRSSFRPRVHYTKMSSTRERRRSYPHDNSRDSSSSHIWWSLDRLTVNPKYRLIIFLKEDLAGLTSRSEVVGDGDDSGDDGGAP